VACRKALGLCLLSPPRVPLRNRIEHPDSARIGRVEGAVGLNNERSQGGFCYNVRMSKLIVVLVGIASLAGCGAMDPLAGSPNPAGNSGLKAGLYVGMTTCRDTNNGITTSSTFVSTTRVNPQGIPDGWVVGIVKESESGTVDTRLEATHVGVTPGIFSIDIDVTQILCANTCQFAFDGVCDEVQFCLVARDCADCGSLETIGFGTWTYTAVNEHQIRLVTNTTQSDNDGFFLHDSFCDGLLTR